MADFSCAPRSLVMTSNSKLSPMKRLFFMTVGFVLMGIAIIVVFPTLLIAHEGGFKHREVLSERATDGSLRVVVTKRVAFPAYDLLDPSVVIRAELSDLATHEVVASTRAFLLEDSDFSRPVVQWYSGGVRLTGFDGRTNQMMRLRDMRLRESARAPEVPLPVRQDEPP